MEFIKENLLTIVLVSLIIIVFILLGIFAYKIGAKEKNEEEIKIAEVKEDISNERPYDTQEVISGNTKIEENNSYSQEKDTRLVQIANIFNSSNATEEMRLGGYTLNATALQDGITVFSSGDGLTFDIKFVLNDNVLSTKIIYNQTVPEASSIEMMLAIILIDSVGQMKGLPERTLIKDLLTNENSINYTIENNGIQVEQLDGNQGAIIKVDLESDFSNI